MPGATMPKPSNVLLIKIHGKPYGQARPRARGFVAGTRAIVTMYDPAANKLNKRRVHDALDRAFEERGAEWDATGPMDVTIEARYPCLNKLKTSKREQAWRAKKPDADNIAKWVLDALEPLVFLNDSQVVSLRVLKVVAHQDDPPCTTVRVERLDNQPLRRMM